ncbi:ATP-dependent DNA helicase RRM3 [Frankliniella fusca]|uniref:ATP-dependent DNA helicase RRM3 n=1 Tax=Frankliniella fusca TaxID=407009 RepID=A0AAE1I0L1_9NEOP|nr:ATP-dependent DNA helicase RRM3 [Frankliniella fusca]
MDFPWNLEQRAVLELFEVSKAGTKPMYCRVDGPAASGKSALIQEIAARARAYYGSAESVMVVAPTHTAADAVGGRTMHSALWLPFEPPLDTLEDPLPLGLDAVRLLIIDNANQAHPWVLNGIDTRFRVGCSSSERRRVYSGPRFPRLRRPAAFANDTMLLMLQAHDGDGQWFGGRSTFVFEDGASLDPPPPQSFHPDYWTVAITKSFPTRITLRTTYFNDASFGAAMARLERGVVSPEDRARFEDRCLLNMEPAQRARWADAPRVYAGNVDADMFTDVYSNDHPPPAVGARSYSRASRQGPSNVTLWPGAPVILTTAVPGVAEAGTQGVVSSLADQSVGVQLGAGEDLVTITLTEPLPLAAPQGYTLPRAMGLRFDKVIVVLPERRWGGDRFQYAAVSRAKGWESIAFSDIVPSMED